MSIVTSNGLKLSNSNLKKFIYKRKVLFDYLKSKKLLYLKSHLNKLLNADNVGIVHLNFFIKKSKILSRAEFEDMLLKILNDSFIEVKKPKRYKEKSENLANRQKVYRQKQSENKQLLQIYIKKDIFDKLETIRLSKDLSKQLFYSSIIEEKY